MIATPSAGHAWLGSRFTLHDLAHTSIDLHRLRESEERFRSAFENAAIGMALVSTTGQWLRVNQALCRIVGYSTTELLSTDFQSLTHPDDLRADLKSFREMLAGTREYYEMEKRYFHKTGRIIWVLLSVSLVREEDGEPLYFISQLQDITERKRLEQALRELTSGEQQRLGRELHDGLGQELTGLSLLARAFATKAERAGSHLADDAIALSELATNAVATCRDIVRGVSPLTESQGGLVRGVRQLAERVATISGRNVRFTVIEEAPVTLPWYSRTQLYRIGQEALNNAIAHSRGERIDVRLVIDARAVRVEVLDDGIGFIPSEYEDRGLGLDAMRYRAATLNARLIIGPREEGGSQVICDCPQ
jgi:PAS domain S-box-containing protein